MHRNAARSTQPCPAVGRRSRQGRVGARSGDSNVIRSLSAAARPPDVSRRASSRRMSSASSTSVCSLATSITGRPELNDSAAMLAAFS